MSSPGNRTAPVVADLGERALIARIHRRVPPAPDYLLIGIGDDAAVLAPQRGMFEVITTDALIEGVHFDPRFSSAADVGFKAIAVNASDIAAMGGAPRVALLSLMLPQTLPVSYLDELLDGILEMTRLCGATVAGGNITRSPGPLIVDVTLTGTVKPRKYLTRDGGRPGEALYLTGVIGAAAAGLEWLRSRAVGGPARLDAAAQAPPRPGSGGAHSESALMAECVARHQRPDPRLRIGALLGRNRAASACMDLSDGLAAAVCQIAQASGTGATIDAAALPLHPGARQWFMEAGKDPVAASLSGGDDYELLFAVSTRARGRFRAVTSQARGVPITRIGELTADRAIQVVRDGRTEPLPSGFTHF